MITVTPEDSTGERGKKNNKLPAQDSNQQRQDGAGVPGNGQSPVKILKTESAFARSGAPKNVHNKRLTFADECGDKIAENVFVEQLHYSSTNYSSTEIQKGCCIIS